MATSFLDPTVTAILGATNTGKTHYAIERMLAHSTGVIGLPLRLLAREVYDRICRIKGAHQCALITGEEKIVPPKARFFVCTVEAMPVKGARLKGIKPSNIATPRDFAFVAIDEIQLMNHPERGHIFTDRLLHARGTEETLFLGADTAGPLIKILLDKVSFQKRERLSTLTHTGPSKITRLPKRSVIVAFSAKNVYTIAELMRRYRGGAAVVMGGLSPRTRNAQAELFQSGEVDFLVATDAVGMGLNLDTHHVAFAQVSKFDGRRRRMLMPMEIGQIAGRAGRFRTDGSFGTTGDCPAFDEDTISRVEAHNYEAFYQAEWRNTDLDFTSLDSLRKTLYMPRPNRNLRRIKGAVDELSFERLTAIPEIVNAINIPMDVKRLWDVCQIPDFRNMTIDAHVRLLQDIYRLIVKTQGKIPEDYMAKQIDRIADSLDVSGVSVDVLSTRLSQIRTWTYCANKIEWMTNAQEWVERTRNVEDKLSDALHESLIARFVDRKTNALLKTIGAGTNMDAKILDDGKVMIDDHLIGQLDGIDFKLADSTSELEGKALKAAAEKVVAPEVDKRLTSLCGGTHAIFRLDNTGQIMWGDKAVGKIGKGGTVFNPDVELIGGDYGQDTLQNMAQTRMRDFLNAEVIEKLAPLKLLKDLSENTDVPAEVRGVAFELFENYGVLERKTHGAKIKALTQDMRVHLRQVNITFGQYHIFLRDLMKPKPATLLSLLTSFGAGGDKTPFIPFAGMTSLKSEGDMLSDNFTSEAIRIAGYAALGPRIIRLDILDRLSKLIRQAQERGQRNSFQIMQEMLSLLGSTLDEVRGVLSAMGFKSQNGEADPAELKKIAARAAERQSVLEAKNKPAPVEPAKTAATEIPPVSADTAKAPDKAPGGVDDANTQTKSAPVDSAPATPIPAAPKANPRARRELSVHHERETLEDGTVADKPNIEYWFMPSRRQNQSGQNQSGQKNRQKPYNKTKKHQGGRQKSGGSNYQSKPTKRDIENSPFAALAALKNPKKD